MHYITIFIACIMVVIMYKILAKKSIHLGSGMVIEPCRACGASGYVDGAFCETYVRCNNPACAMTGPNGKDARAAISAWNRLTSMTTVVAWQFQAAGAALALQRLMDAAKHLRETQDAYDQYGSNEDSLIEAEEVFNGLLDDLRYKAGAHHV